MIRVNFTYETFNGKTTVLYFFTMDGSVHLFDGRSIPGVVEVESKVLITSGRGRSRRHSSDFWLKIYDGVKVASFWDPLPASVKSLPMLASSLHVSEQEAITIMQVHNREYLNNIL